MNFPTELRYSKDHEWAKMEGNIATIGITDYAQDALGDVVFVELPMVGKEFSVGAEVGVVESVKSVSSLYAPVAGKVITVNKELEAHSELINKSPYAQGWIAKIEVSNPADIEQLLTAPQYQAILKK